MQRQTDRVNYSYSMKIPGPVQFSSITFSSSYSTDLQPEETPEDAMDRARKFVLAEVEKDYDANSSGDREADDDEFAVKAKVQKKGKRKRDSEDEEEDED